MVEKANATMVNFGGTKFKPTDWPEGVLEYMECGPICALFVLRTLSGIPMWPSALAKAHVRFTGSKTSAHYANKETGELSQGTDMHVKTHESLAKLLRVVPQVTLIGGFGIYFNTNTPMFHIDTRPEPLWWIVTSAGDYIYYENGPEKFYKVLAEELSKT